MHTYNFRVHPHVVDFAEGDVNGDEIVDKVFLTGQQTLDSPYTQNITLVIQDGKTGKFISVPLRDQAGYTPTVFLGDFTGNGVSEIMISIATGGSGGTMIYYIYSFFNNELALLFHYNDYNSQYKYTVSFKDDYKVEVKSLANDQRYIIDISTKDFAYLHEIYDLTGLLKKPISGFVNPLSGLFPIDFGSKKVYQLLAYQRIAGRYNADSLGYVLNTLKWNGTRFLLEAQNVAIFGSRHLNS